MADVADRHKGLGHFNVEAEMAVIGAVLEDARMLDSLPAIEPGDFHDPVLASVWQEVTRLARAGRASDPIALRSWWKEQPSAQDLGAFFIVELFERAPRLKHQAREFAALVLDLSAKRQIAGMLDEAQDALRAQTATEAVHGLERQLRQVRTGAARSGRALNDAAAALLERIDDPNARGLATGFAALDDRLGGLFPGELILLAGRPSSGKTALATNIARGLGYRGKRVHFASYEMADEQIAARSLSAADFDGETQASSFAYAQIRRGAPGIDRDRLRNLAQRLPRSVIIEDGGAQTLAELDASIRDTQRRLNGVDAVVVDYLQLMRPTVRGSRNDQITEISQGLKHLAKRYRVPILALSQLSRANETREDKRPQLSDLRDSGSLEQDADVVLGIYREAYYLERSEPQRPSFKNDEDYNLAWSEWDLKRRRAEKELEVITLKQRNGAVGTDLLDFWAKFDVAADRGGRAA